jgi:hypothetical protein
VVGVLVALAANSSRSIVRETNRINPDDLVISPLLKPQRDSVRIQNTQRRESAMSRSHIRAFIVGVIAVSTTALWPGAGLTQTIDISGTWGSDWGPVTLKTGTNGAVTGSWEQGESKHGQITGGSFDMSSGRLQFWFYQPWNNETGSASLQLSGNWDEVLSEDPLQGLVKPELKWPAVDEEQLPNRFCSLQEHLDYNREFDTKIFHPAYDIFRSAQHYDSEVGLRLQSIKNKIDDEEGRVSDTMVLTGTWQHSSGKGSWNMSRASSLPFNPRQLAELRRQLALVKTEKAASEEWLNRQTNKWLTYAPIRDRVYAAPQVECGACEKITLFETSQPLSGKIHLSRKTFPYQFGTKGSTGYGKGIWTVTPGVACGSENHLSLPLYSSGSTQEEYFTYSSQEGATPGKQVLAPSSLLKHARVTFDTGATLSSDGWLDLGEIPAEVKRITRIEMDMDTGTNGTSTLVWQ